MAKMEDTNAIDEAKTNLKGSISSLEREIDIASKRLETLESEIKTSKIGWFAAKLRYEKLQRLAGALCDKCWEILPALGKDVHTIAMKPSDKDKSCVNCKTSIEDPSSGRYSHKKFLLPPDNARVLERSEKAWREASVLVHGKSSTARINEDCRRSLKPWESNVHPIGLYHNQKGMNAAQEDEHFAVVRTQQDRLIKIERKKEYLNLVSRQVEQAKEQFDSAVKASKEWKKYHDKHSSQLDKMKKQLRNLEECERKVLQSKLDQLNGPQKRYQSARNRDSNCSVCWEHPKDIAFQCGHQCCTSCAKRMRVCHFCRSSISLRIKLYSS